MPGKDEFTPLAERFPEFPMLLNLDGAAFARGMGPEWAERHPDVPLLLDAAELKGVVEGGSLEPRLLRLALERFLSDPRIFGDRSALVGWVVATYRALLLKLWPEFWKELDPRLRESYADPARHVREALLALNAWPDDARRDPESWRLWFSAGFSFGRLGEPEKAEICLEQALAHAPDSLPVMNELASLKLQQGLLDDGARLLDQVLAREPDDVTALGNLGALRIQTGRPIEARAILERAVALAPDDAHLRRLLALAAGDGA